MKYNVWYMKPDTFMFLIHGYQFAKDKGVVPNSFEDLERTHVHLKDEEAENLEDLFVKMQGENWSPNGEARPLIEEKGLAHTSMSVGDVAVCDDGVYFCDNVGWKQLTSWEGR